VDAVVEPYPDAELTGLVKGREVGRLFRHPDHLVDRRDPRPVKVAHGVADGGSPLLRGDRRHDGVGSGRVEPELRRLVEDPGRVSGLVALDPAARRILGRAVDAGGRERRAARGHDVLADPAEHDRPTTRGSIELMTVRESLLGVPGGGQPVALEPGAVR